MMPIHQVGLTNGLRNVNFSIFLKKLNNIISYKPLGTLILYLIHLIFQMKYK
jgi:hypothetical protein